MDLSCLREAVDKPFGAGDIHFNSLDSLAQLRLFRPKFGGGCNLALHVKGSLYGGGEVCAQSIPLHGQSSQTLSQAANLTQQVVRAARDDTIILNTFTIPRTP